MKLKYCLHLADDTLILGHRNSEWTGHGPILEQDIALSNIALDLIGQARHFYQYASAVKNDGTTEDHFAYLRNENEFFNCLLVEQENGDWGKTILRQFLYSAYQYPLYQQLKKSNDLQLAAIAEKSLKEVTYHLRWSSEWVIRLGQGTPESHQRMQSAVNELWKYTAELYTPANYENDIVLSGQQQIQYDWHRLTSDIIQQAELQIPSEVDMMQGGKEGKHTSLLKELLNEMQYMQRTYPAMEW